MNEKDGVTGTIHAIGVLESWKERGFEPRLHWIQDLDIPNKKYLAWYVEGHPEEGEVVYLL